MSKYVIELRPDCKVVQQICESDGQLYIGSKSLNYFEELNADYINEHFGDLQDDAYNKGYAQCQDDYSDALKHAKDTAYQKGFEDGKWKSEDGCTGCKYEGKTGEHLPCDYCMNNFKNQWTAKDDEIEVGDEVEWDNDFTGDRFIVTRIYQPYGKKEQCDGIDDDGDVYRAVLIESLVKTGRHFDIASILEVMRND